MPATLTPAGQGLVARAEQVAIAANAFAEAAAAQSRGVSGTVRITTEEVYAITLLAPLLRELHDAYPDIIIDLDTSQRIRDLGAGEADFSLRTTKGDPEGGGLVGRLLGRDDWALYCSRSYADRHGVPPQRRRNEAARIHRRRRRAFVDLLPGVAEDARARTAGRGSPCHLGRPAVGGAVGLGVAVLPCIVADADPDLIRCVAPLTEHRRMLWLFTHERCHHTPRVRAVIDFIYDRLSKHVRELEAREAVAAA